MGLSNWHRGPEVGDIQGKIRRLWQGGWGAGQWVKDVPMSLSLEPYLSSLITAALNNELDSWGLGRGVTKREGDFGLKTRGKGTLTVGSCVEGLTLTLSLLPLTYLVVSEEEP